MATEGFFLRHSGCRKVRTHPPISRLSCVFRKSLAKSVQEGPRSLPFGGEPETLRALRGSGGPWEGLRESAPIGTEIVVVSVEWLVLENVFDVREDVVTCTW